MKRNDDNYRRVFAEIVSIDAWHRPFGESEKGVDLHIDVVFMEDRFGDEPNEPVRFRMSLKQAEVVVVISDTEPVSVDRNSVSRTIDETVGKRTFTSKRAGSVAANAGANLKVGPTGVSGDLAAGAKAEGRSETAETFHMETHTSIMDVQHSKTPEGHYRWTVKPTVGTKLLGSPWPALTSPRLTMIDERLDPTLGIEPVASIEIRCRREDLVIEDLQIKDKKKWDEARKKRGFENQMKAAEAYIRNRLHDMDFSVGDISEPFSKLVLASVTARDNGRDEA